MYSLDRDGWVRVRDLHVGERLRTAEGAVIVDGLQKVRGSHRSYNLEAQGDHEYLVSKARVRAHNNGCGPRAGYNGVEGPVQILEIRVQRRGAAAGELGIRVRYPDASMKDITRTRLKEFVSSTHPNAPPGAMQRVKFGDRAHPGSKGLKRDPTLEELEFLCDATR